MAMRRPDPAGKPSQIALAILERSRVLHDSATLHRQRVTDGNVPLFDFYQFTQDVRDTVLQLGQQRNVPGLVGALRDEVDDQTWDVATEVLAWRNAMASFLAAVDGGFPESADGSLRLVEWDGTNTGTPQQVRLLAPADNALLTALGNQLDTLLASWD